MQVKALDAARYAKELESAQHEAALEKARRKEAYAQCALPPASLQTCNPKRAHTVSATRGDVTRCNGSEQPQITRR